MTTIDTERREKPLSKSRRSKLVRAMADNAIEHMVDELEDYFLHSSEEWFDLNLTKAEKVALLHEALQLLGTFLASRKW